MDDARRLRTRLLAALAAGGLLSPLGGGCASTTTGNAQDAGADTRATPDAAPAPDTTPAPDAAPPPDVWPPPPPTCEGGPGRATWRCYTPEELERVVHNPPQGGDTGDAGRIDAGVAPNGCYDGRWVQDGCCNAASAGPYRDGDRCCYYHCAGACCGRPFVVEGEARVAAVVPRADWLAPTPSPGATDDVTRAALAAAWRADAAMEHASVASFARFTLALLAAGAAPDLVADAQRAALDEVEHARLCFGLASRHGGEDVGPGALDVAGAAAGASLADAVAAAVREGCVGETVAALTAGAQRTHAADPAARAALARIADDEAAHAALAWRFVAWALARGDRGVRAAAARAFAEALARPPAVADDPPGIDAAAWRAAGRLTAREARDVAREALREVVGPCARALLGGATPSARAASPAASST